MNKTEQAFKDELDALLKKYSVELEIQDVGKYHTKYNLNAFADFEYDENGDVKNETINLNFGRFYTGE